MESLACELFVYIISTGPDHACTIFQIDSVIDTLLCLAETAVSMCVHFAQAHHDCTVL